MKLLTTIVASLLLASSALAEEPATHPAHAGDATPAGHMGTTSGNETKSGSEAKPSAKHASKKKVSKKKVSKKHTAKAGDQTEKAAQPKQQ